MVSDRFGALTVQAAAEGAIDFQRADRFDRNWWRRLRLTLEYLDRQNGAQLLEQELEITLQELTSPLVYSDPVIGKLCLDRLDRLQKELKQSRRPWIKFQERSPQDTIKAMADQYAEEFMDPNSPEFDVELKRLQEYWASDKEDENF